MWPKGRVVLRMKLLPKAGTLKLAPWRRHWNSMEPRHFPFLPRERALWVCGVGMACICEHLCVSCKHVPLSKRAPGGKSRLWETVNIVLTEALHSTAMGCLLGLNWVRIFLLSRLLYTISWTEDSGRNENISNTTKIQVWPCGRCWQRGWQPVQVCRGLFQLSLAGPDPENLSGPRPTWVAGLPAESTKGPPAGKVFLLFTVSPGLLYQDVPGDTPSNHSRSLKTQRMKSGASHSAWLWDCPDIRYYPSKGLTEGSGMFGISLAFLWLAH